MYLLGLVFLPVSHVLERKGVVEWNLISCEVHLRPACRIESTDAKFFNGYRLITLL